MNRQFGMVRAMRKLFKRNVIRNESFLFLERSMFRSSENHNNKINIFYKILFWFDFRSLRMSEMVLKVAKLCHFLFALNS